MASRLGLKLRVKLTLLTPVPWLTVTGMPKPAAAETLMG